MSHPARRTRFTVRRRELSAFTLMCAAAVAVGVGMVAMIPTAPDPAPWRTLPACAQEDAAGPCYWNAARQGNGRGTSFYVTEAGEVVPVP